MKKNNIEIGFLTHTDFNLRKTKTDAYQKFVDILLRQASAKKIKAVVFEYESIDFRKKTVCGFDENFKKGTFNLPRVLYVVGASNQPERKLMKEKVREKMRNLGVVRLNSYAFCELTKNKLATYRIFKKNGVKQPNSSIFKKNVLENYLRKFEEVFVKLRSGMRRHGMMIIKKESSSKYQLDFFYEEKSKKKKKFFSNLKENELESLMRKLAESLNLSLDQYIIQQGIDVFRIEDKRVFFRSMFLRGEKGRVKEFFLGGRLLGKDGLADSSKKNDEVLGEIARQTTGKKSDGKKLYQKIKKESRKGLKALEKEVGPIGEIGFDVVLDKKGEPWIIEANSNPGHTTTPMTSLAGCVVDYLIYLSSKIDK